MLLTMLGAVYCTVGFFAYTPGVAGLIMVYIMGVVDPRPCSAVDIVQVMVDHAQTEPAGATVPPGVPRGVVVLTDGREWSPTSGKRSSPSEDALIAVTGHSLAANTAVGDLRFGGVTLDTVECSETVRAHPNCRRVSVQVTGLATVFMYLSPRFRELLTAGAFVAVHWLKDPKQNMIYGHSDYYPFRVGIYERRAREMLDGSFHDSYGKVNTNKVTIIGRLVSWGAPGKNELLVNLLQNPPTALGNVFFQQTTAGGMGDAPQPPVISVASQKIRRDTKAILSEMHTAPGDLVPLRRANADPITAVRCKTPATFVAKTNGDIRLHTVFDNHLMGKIDKKAIKMLAKVPLQNIDAHATRGAYTAFKNDMVPPHEHNDLDSMIHLRAPQLGRILGIRGASESPGAGWSTTAWPNRTRPSGANPESVYWAVDGHWQ